MKNALLIFFKKMTARNGTVTIEELEKQGEGKIVRERKDLLETVEEYYAQLFREEKVDRDLEVKYLDHLDKRVPEEVREELGGDITVEEMYNAVRSMKNNRVPGIDGLTKEFYMTF